jgi:peroxiredoxin
MELPAEMRGGAYQMGPVGMYRDVPLPAIPQPEEVLLMTWEERAKWREAFGKTAEGKALDAARQAAVEGRKYVFVQAQADGTFRVEDVTAGTYVLQGSFSKKGDRQQTPVAWVQLPVKVEMPGGAAVSDQAVDLGVVTATALATVAVGEKATDFSISLPEGRLVRLMDYAGKQVAVVFWSAQVGMNAADVAAMRELGKMQAEGLVLLSVNVDEKSEIGRKFAQKYGWTFETLYAGPMKKQAGLAAYGEYPRRFLVAKDGTILAVNDVSSMVARVGGAAMILK